MTAYLASDDAWNVNGQIFHVYGGIVSVLQHPTPWQAIFKRGMWTLDELTAMVPQMMDGTTNPAPPPDELEVPGRNVQARA